ncbi:hypothetical protein [Stappia sp. WLB 29]|uniref:hypothetical protein n=1 Tax=Stappia sp. WLB 29 TaxID=2925220 RepID=UPI0020BE76C3|nr:hypothetical protein [Stappia sp. WLB 29]
MKATAGFDRAPLDSELDGGEGRRLKLENRLTLGLEVDRGFDLGSGREALVGFGVRRETYPAVSEGNRLFFDARLAYHHDLPGDRRQLRFNLDATTALDPSDEVFSRLRIGGTYRMGVAPRQMFWTRLRYSYRDQNEENTFSGYDQSEWLGEFNYAWQSSDWNWYVLATLYQEQRYADRDRYSYTENGIRMLARYRLNPETRIALRASGFARDYVGGGREDRRLRSTLGFEKSLNDAVTLEAYAGYVHNHSNDIQKAFSGALIGVMLNYTFP